MAAMFDAPEPTDCYRRTRSVLPQQALGGVVHPGEHHVAHEREDDSVGMQRPNAAEGRVLGIKIEDGVHKLKRGREAHQHAHQSEDDGSDHEGFNNLVVVAEFLNFHSEEAGFY